MDIVATLDRLIELLRRAGFTDDEIYEFCIVEPTFDKFLEVYEAHLS